MAQKEHHTKDGLSLIVVGGLESGKTSVCSALLGQLDTPKGYTASCVKHDGQLNGKRLTVVDTPGWLKNLRLIDNAERIKHELVLSVRLCPPGPHAFILTVEINSFSEKNRKSVEEHLGLFGEKVWEYIIVVFTRGESLKGRSIDQHIEIEGQTLKWVLQKCGKRYCVYDKQLKDQNHVFQLLKKIEGIVASNHGRHFEPDEKTLREVEEKKRSAGEQANARQQKVEELRKLLREKDHIQPLSDVRIVMLGWVSCGKSSAKNVILNKENHPPQTQFNEKQSGLVGDRLVTVVDTPGWWKYFSAQYTPEWVKTQLERSVTLGSKAPHALLLVVPADVSFLEEQRRIIQENMKMFFGEMAWRYTLVLFTWGDRLGNTTIEEHIESEGEPLKWLVERCGNRYHVFDNINRGDGSQICQLLEKIDEMEARVDSCDLTQEAQEIGTTESQKQEEEVRPEMMKYLKDEWSRRVKELEKKVREDSQFDSAVMGSRSMDCYTDLSNQQPDSHQQSAEDRKREALEREWERWIEIIMGQVPRVTFPEPYASSCEPYEIPGQTEHEPLDQATARNMKDMVEREWARHESILIKKIGGLITQLSSRLESSSEVSEHELQQSREKVLNWRTTSGLGSELEDEDVCFAE